MGFAKSDMTLTSSAFTADGLIPAKHSGEGENVSPALAWSDLPEGTESLAIFCHDPDAPLVASDGTYGFVHWVLYNIPASVTELEEGTAKYTAGNNDLDGPGYGGPFPPKGHGLHRYYFWLLALNEKSHLRKGLRLGQLLKRIEPHVIGMNRLVGVYRRE